MEGRRKCDEGGRREERGEGEVGQFLQDAFRRGDRNGKRARAGAGAAARGSAWGGRWMEGKMDRELDLPNLPPR